MSWQVDYARAFIAWVTTAAPDDTTIDAVAEWIQSVIDTGPPDDSVEVGDDLYVAIVPVGVVVSFLAIAQDRCIIVREFS